MRQCFHRNKDCDICGKKRHLGVVCKVQRKHSKDNSKGKGKEKIRYVTQNVKTDSESEDSDSSVSSIVSDIRKAKARTGSSPPIHSINRVGEKKAPPPCFIEIKIEKQKIKMEYDSGAAISGISKQDYEKYFAKYKLHKTVETFTNYDKSTARPLAY